MRGSELKRFVAVALVLTTTFITTPISAAEFAPKGALGSVSAVGNVQLRGITISQEGTLFAGDSVRANEKAYAKVLLHNGNKIEVGEKTEITVNEGVIALLAGNVNFSGRNPVRIAFEPFEITATDAAGNISVNAGTAAGVRSLNGTVTVRNKKTQQSYVLTKGQERWFGLNDGSAPKPLAELASAVPDAVPLPMPQTPAGQTGGGLAMDAGAWAAVIAAGAITGLSIWGLIVALGNQDDIDELQSQIDDLEGTISAGQSASLAAIAALQRAQQMSDAAFNARINALAIAQTGAQIQLAVNAAPNLTSAQRSNFNQRAQALASQANQISQQIISIEGQINALESQIAASGTVTAAQQSQLDTLRNNLNTQINALNTIRAQESQLISELQQAGVQGVTQTSQPSPTASVSVPQ
jgi:hypothetical protein